MTPIDAAKLLTLAAAFDNRKPDVDAAEAWALALDGYRYDDCRAVVLEHYRRGSEWLMPSMVIADVKRLRSKRIDDYGYIEPPAGIDPDDTGAYVAWLERTKRAIADGVLTAPQPVPMLTAAPGNRQRRGNPTALDASDLSPAVSSVPGVMGA